ncbi:MULTISPECIES: sensor histidine kinase [Enterococcaceae]|uniref:sensor histidine kinase n=1 Tax=Enterococcaceae TaxID=81852 RepID=UPI000E543476|nr:MULTISPECIES: sensor histidine kinase [Enterococcaceae]RGI31044.1 sensor histidine kinase [Melissococcus sp. OM08-11BH]UNM89006.1 sensor histidine kinase [Vagococcus sp. CY52-2]
MKAKLHRLFSKNILMNQLMTIYSLLLVGSIGIILIGYTILTVNFTRDDSKKVLDTVSRELTASIQVKDATLSGILWDIALTPNQFDNLNQFMTLPISEYVEYSLDNWRETNNNDFFPNVLNNLFYSFPSIQTIDIVWDGREDYLHADTRKTNGVFLQGKPVISKDFTLSRPIPIPNTREMVGHIYVTFDDMFLSKDLANDYAVKTFVFDTGHQVVYEHGTSLNDKKINQIVENFQKTGDLDRTTLQKEAVFNDEVVKGLTVLTILDKSNVTKDILHSLIPVWGVGLFVIAFLLVSLKRVFSNYAKKVNSIVSVTKEVSQGNLSAQIDTTDMKMELCDLSDAVNDMIVSLNQYIQDVYVLEVKQRDAHLRALQSQINPHFMYNTLEYIRMYAISKDQMELADVVFAFSSLLRNNIDQAKTIDLESELSFCEKYVYLYQMRFPDSIAYHFIIDESLKNFTIPKFMIQPLIENYFIHGMDHSRIDNAISVKATTHDSYVEILVEDNGKGITTEKLKEVTEKLEGSDTLLSGSIGLENVYQRMQNYFSNGVELVIESQIGVGTKIQIIIYQPKDVSVDV